MIQRLLPFITLIVLIVALAIASPHFLTNTNLSSVVRQTAVINIMALGMTLIIVSGGIDLSVGAILAMGGLLGTMAMEKGYPIPAGIVVGIVTGVETDVGLGEFREPDRQVHVGARIIHRPVGAVAVGVLTKRDPAELERAVE